MKIFKLNEFRNQNRELTVNDLSMWLKKGDKVKIKKLEDDRIVNGTVISFNNISIGVKAGGIISRFDLSGINTEWELINVNGDDILIEEKKLNESTGNYVKIATNEIYWGWEYDTNVITATLYFDPTGSNELFLSIDRVHTKSGIGKGSFPSNIVSYEPVGTSKKPELKKIQKLLSKHKYSDSATRAGGGGFKRQWTDKKGEKKALGAIIKDSRFLKMSNLQNKLAGESDDITMTYQEFKAVLYAYGAIQRILELDKDLAPGLQSISDELAEVVKKYKK